ncbi:GntR family transcriptional regulator [Nocardia sp. CA2R105]|uniref:GntR family transcriptional regulator n=1 Tax=Nocardia coffeae TaxID=2873381 RepID=UPI001CA5F802|nr:GntR family transcriptional regulator [Nocardia coffeae]MBY8863445.1 GntR family transcriptional regulator [Nocardia coffeae]
MTSSLPLASRVDKIANLLDGDVPMQVQIYRQLKSEIVDGLWIGRDGFPGERELADRFGVSVITSRNALERLAREGFIERGRGRRSRATFTPGGTSPALSFNMFPPPDVPSLRHKLISHGIDIAPSEACRVFGLDPGSQLWQALRVVSLGRKPLSVSHHVQPIELGKRHSLKDLKTRHMFDMFVSEGTTPVRLHRKLLASTAPPVIAQHLGLPAESPAMMVVLRLEDQHGEPLEWMRAFGRPDQAMAEETLDMATGFWSSAS